MLQSQFGSPIRRQVFRRWVANFAWLICLALLSLQACAPKAEEQAQSVGTSEDLDGIAWFDGDVEEAFQEAKTIGKPVFLYWGAEWCPPCHYLKDKLFTRPDFIARMRNFVPVYLDGDTESAQIWGEKLSVQGYPTVIVFSPTGDEVMRMPSTLPVDQYQEVLDAAMSSTRPVKVVLDEVMTTGPSSAKAADLTTLAFYSWSQDTSVDLEPADMQAIFRRLYDETTADLEVERSRFLTQYLISAAAAQRQSSDGDEVDQIGDDDLERLRPEAVQVLRNDDLRSANLVWVLYYSTDTIDLLTPNPGPDRDALIAAWQAAAAEIEDDPTLTVNDRLSAIMPQIALAKLASAAQAGEQDGTTWEASEEFKQHVRERVAWAADEVSAEGELQTTMNTMAYLLSGVGLESEAEALLAARMNDTVAPYYFMSWLGSIKEEAGDTTEALAWYRKAYESSTGRYSRFRWGSMYLRHLLELAPDDAPTIEEHSKEVLSELLALDDAFSGGNHSRLEGLERSYLDWSEEGERAATLAAVRDFVHAACDRFPTEGEDSQSARCWSFLAEDQPAAEETT